MLDSDLAELYGVATKVLNQAVKRNLSRFPEDFMFQLTVKESEILRSQSVTLEKGRNGQNLRSQIVTLEKGRGRYSKYLPYAFTEQGVAMLSSVLNSKRAIQVNIQIMRIFTQLRNMVYFHGELSRYLANLERKLERRLGSQAGKIHKLFQAIKQLMGHVQHHELRLSEHWKHISK
jgi:hypothetical protein